MNYIQVHDVKSIKAKRTIHHNFHSLTLTAIDDEGRETTLIFFSDDAVVIDFKGTETDGDYE